jgi:hypothetical protein
MEVLDKAKVGMRKVTAIPDDYDVMVTYSAGCDDFERACLDESHRKGKINVKAHNSISIYNQLVNINYTTERVQGRLDYICMRDRRSVEHFKRFLSGVRLLNVGDPDWDYFKTDVFKQEVSRVIDAYGKKLLLICCGFDMNHKECTYWPMIVKHAIQQGFKILMSCHPGHESRMSKDMQKYKVPKDLHHHVLFAAASHVICEPSSTVIAESMMLRTKVCCYPYIPHAGNVYGVTGWASESDEWRKAMQNCMGPELLSFMPVTASASLLQDFLDSPTPLISEDQTDMLFGWPKVESYSSNFFDTLERDILEAGKWK